MALEEAFADFEIEEEESKVKKWCSPEDFHPSIHNEQWFLKDDASQAIADPKELDYFRAMYYLENKDYPLALKALQDWRSNCCHRGFFLIQVLDSMLRIALRDPTCSKEVINSLLEQLTSIVTIPGDQIQLWGLELKATLRFQTSFVQFLRCSILLVTTSPFLPEFWINFTKWPKKVGPNLHVGGLARAILLSRYQLEQGMAVGFIKEKLKADINRWTAQLDLLPDEMKTKAFDEMSLSRDRQFQSRVEEKDDSATLPAHDCRNKDAVFYTQQMCIDAINSFKKRYNWLLIDCDLE